jgi:hypothetical protein
MVSTEDAMNYVDLTHLENTFRDLDTAQGVALSDWAKPSSVEVKFTNGGTKQRHIPIVDHEATANFRLGVIEALQIENGRLRADLKTAANLYFGLIQEAEPIPTPGEVLAKVLSSDDYWTGA